MLSDRTLLLFFYTLTLQILFPQWPITFFAPFLVITFYKKPLTTCLWFSLIAGLIVDLLSDQSRLGLYALNYCITTSILYSQKSYFFEDSLSTTPLLTFIFAIISTLIQTTILYSLGHQLLLTKSWVISDLIWMPIIDALYAGIAFTLPSLFIPKQSPKRTRHFSLKEKSHE